MRIPDANTSESESSDEEENGVVTPETGQETVSDLSTGSPVGSGLEDKDGDVISIDNIGEVTPRSWEHKKQVHEMCLILQMTFPTHSMSLLRDPNVWIGDTRVTANTCFDKTGCTNKRENNALSLGIEGKATGCISECDIPGIICDKHGNEIQSVTVTNCRNNPKANFNLLSLTKLLKDGWQMAGDDESITMSKGPTSIKFDIVIPTQNGAIYAT